MRRRLLGRELKPALKKEKKRQPHSWEGKGEMRWEIFAPIMQEVQSSSSSDLGDAAN